MDEQTRQELFVMAQWRLGWPARDIAEAIGIDICTVYQVLVKRRVMKRIPAYIAARCR